MLEETLARVLSRVTEFSVATGEATDGSTTTLKDTTAVWETNKWAGAVVEITHNSKHYFVTITSNTADTLTFPAIAEAVTAGDHYEIRMTLRLADIDKWGGTDLTGRDISLDIANLDLALTGLRDAICAASPNAKTLNDLYGYLARANQLTPLEKANEHNTAETADTDILASALSPTNTPCLFRVMVCVDTAGVFFATITKAGNTQVVEFNGGANLTANALYIFDHLVHDGDTINYRHSVNTTLRVLRVQEIVGASQ